MNNALKWLLILGGGAFLLKDQLRDLLGSGPSAPAQPAEPADTNHPAEPPPAAQTTLQMMRDYATKHAMGTLNFDQWNWVYSQVRGHAGPPIEEVFPGQARERLMTLDEWWAGVSQHGLSGVPNWTSRAWGY